MGWTVEYRRGTDNEHVTQNASSEAAARNNYAKLTAEAHEDDPKWVELKGDDVLVERWAK
jgi:hypothetical protein